MITRWGFFLSIKDLINFKLNKAISKQIEESYILCMLHLKHVIKMTNVLLKLNGNEQNDALIKMTKIINRRTKDFHGHIYITNLNELNNCSLFSLTEFF